MIDRILSVIKLKNLSPSQFADEIGFQRSGMSHLLSGRNKPSLEFILKVLKRFPEIDPGWLLLGKSKTDTEVTNFEISSFPVEKSINEKRPDEKNKSIKDSEGQEKTESSIEKIVILYRDRSFKDYNPE